MRWVRASPLYFDLFMTLRALFGSILKEMLLMVWIRLTRPPKTTLWASGQRPMMLPIRRTGLAIAYSSLEAVGRLAFWSYSTLWRYSS